MGDVGFEDGVFEWGAGGVASPAGDGEGGGGAGSAEGAVDNGGGGSGGGGSPEEVHRGARNASKIKSPKGG